MAESMKSKLLYSFKGSIFMWIVSLEPRTQGCYNELVSGHLIIIGIMLSFSVADLKVS